MQEQKFISVEQFDEIQSRVENIAKKEEYQKVSDLLQRAKIAKAISKVYVAEHNQDKLEIAKIAGELLFFFIKNDIVCFGERTEQDLLFAWEIFTEEKGLFKTAEKLLEILCDFNKEHLRAREIIAYRTITYLIVSIYANGYNPYSFLLEMVKEKESDFELKKWISDKANSSDEPFCENRGAIDEEEALWIFNQEIKSDFDIEIEFEGVDLINGAFVVGYYVNNRHYKEKNYHEFSVKQVDKVDYEKCKRAESEEQ